MNHADVLDFIRVGLAAICALAWCAFQYDAIRLAVAPQPTKARLKKTA